MSGRSTMKLAKLHGLGNDFLIAQAGETGTAGPSLASFAQSACQRHTGIGADGALFFLPTVGDAEADVSALIYNSDGSRAEMSGNGTRCLAAFLIHSGILHTPTIRIRTVAGIKVFTLREQSGRTYVFESLLGQPTTDPARVPVLVGKGSAALIDFPLSVGSVTVRVTASSMGNPHCSTFWTDLSQAPVETLGPALEQHYCFPNRTNVEFVQVLDRHRIRVRFWERGVGPTLASGTGSAAAAVAAILNGFAESPITVEVELGSLLVQWQSPGELSLTGPAEYVCSADFPDPKCQ
jgi:diaminopimelate epimerase